MLCRDRAADGHIKAYLQQQKIIFVAGIGEAVFIDHCMQISVLEEEKKNL